MVPNIWLPTERPGEIADTRQRIAEFEDQIETEFLAALGLTKPQRVECLRCSRCRGRILNDGVSVTINAPSRVLIFHEVVIHFVALANALSLCSMEPVRRQINAARVYPILRRFFRTLVAPALLFGDTVDHGLSLGHLRRVDRSVIAGQFNYSQSALVYVARQDPGDALMRLNAHHLCPV